MFYDCRCKYNKKTFINNKKIRDVTSSVASLYV